MVIPLVERMPSPAEKPADHEDLLYWEDAGSGLKAVLAIHSTRLGPAAGGIRRRAYASMQEAAEDALRLSAAMTAKCALAGLPAGGGKTVMLQHPRVDAPAAYRALGREIERLGGRYVCGQDVGTSSNDLDEVRKTTRHVTPERDTSAPTARGVLSALRGTLAALDGSRELAGRTFLVQGLGAVGMKVARALLEAGGTVVATDVQREACDVLVPCALGGVLTPEAAARGPFRAVCGSANNILASEDAGRVLHERGVLFAPDFVTSAGGAIDGFLLYAQGDSEETHALIERKLDAIEDTTRRVLDESARRGEPPTAVALRWARERVAAAPRAGPA